MLRRHVLKERGEVLKFTDILCGAGMSMYGRVFSIRPFARTRSPIHARTGAQGQFRNAFRQRSYRGLLNDCLMLDGPEDQDKLRANNPTTICSFDCYKTDDATKHSSSVPVSKGPGSTYRLLSAALRRTLQSKLSAAVTLPLLIQR